ncbi:sensor domain-containing protein [Desulfovibrio psychrotolerans]|nr:PAS domain S-box protein [Desulfovibrio psychrotolerans]
MFLTLHIYGTATGTVAGMVRRMLHGGGVRTFFQAARARARLPSHADLLSPFSPLSLFSLFGLFSLFTLFSLPASGAQASAGKGVAVQGGAGPLLIGAGILAAVWAVSLWVVARRARRDERRVQRREADVLREQYSRALYAAEREAERFRSLFDLAQVSIFRSTLDGKRFIIANQACAESLGYADVEELLRLATPTRLYQDPRMRDVLLDVLQLHGRVDNMELELRRKDGGSLHVMMTATLHKEEGYLQGAVLDVTEYKEAERMLRESHTFLQNILNAMPTPVFFKDAEGRYQLVNLAFEHLFGQSAEQVLGKRVFDVAPRAYAEKYYQMDAALLASCGPAVQQYEYQVVSAGSVRDVMFNKESMFNEDGGLIGLVGVIMDITDRKRMENSLRRAEERYRALYMNAAEGIFTASMEGVFLGVNPAMAGMFGYDSPQAMRVQVRDVGAQLFVQPEQYAELQERLRAERVVSGFEAKVVRADGAVWWASISARGMFGLGDRLERIEGLVVDVTVQKQSAEELARLVITDPLTGIANRIGMNQHLEKTLRQGARSGCRVGLLFIDLDGFKPINDQFGHRVGDMVLAQVAERLCARLRSADLAARVGGDEFSVVLWDVGDCAAVERVSRELLASLGEPYDCDGTLCSVGASMGASLYPAHGTTASDLLSAADSAMYEAKRARARFCMAAEPHAPEENEGAECVQIPAGK